MFGMYNDFDPFRHPTKIINAASFGIPSIATWKVGYREFEKNFILVFAFKELIEEVKKLKNLSCDQELSEKKLSLANLNTLKMFQSYTES